MGLTTSALEQLGTVRAVDEGTTAKQVGAVLEAHRNAILEVAGDVQRTHERIERMIPETRGLMDAAKREARAEWVPAGDAARLDARYLNDAGEVRFGRTTEKVLMPGDNGEPVLVDEVRHGLLTDPYTVTPEHERVHRAYRSWSLARALARKVSPAAARELQRAPWLEFRAAMMALPGQTGEFCRRAFTDPNLFKRVISNVAGQGGELVNTPKISDMIRPTDLARRIAGLIPMIEAPASAFKRPIRSGRGLAKLRGATGDDPARYAIQRFTTSDDTITLKDRVVNVLLDVQWATEGGMVLSDPMGMVADWIAEADADSIELAMMHADTAGTHQDAIASWTIGSRYSSGDLDGSTSPLKFWIGFRAEAFDRSATVAGGGSLGIDDHFGALGLMKALGNDAVAFTGIYNFYTQILANSIFATVDKMGALATQVTGELGKIGKTPVILTDTLQDEYASTGLFTGSGSTDTMVYVNPRAYAHYHHAGGEMEWDVTYPEKGAQYVGMTRRSYLAKTVPSGEVPAAAIINL